MQSNLQFVKASVLATLDLEKVCMLSLFDNLAVLEYEDHVGTADSAEAMRDYEGGSSFHELVQRVSDDLLRSCVER